MAENISLSPELESKIAAAWTAILEGLAEGKVSARETVQAFGLTKAACARYRGKYAERDKEWRQAMRDSADAMRDEHLETVRNDKVEPSRMRARLSGLEWQAAKRDPDQYADRTKVDVEHRLDFKEVFAKMDARLAEAKRMRVVEAEVVEDALLVAEEDDTLL